MMWFRLSLAALAISGLAQSAHAIERGKPVHALSMYGLPKFGPHDIHGDTVNPKAPKGGTLRIGAVGSFDSFNSFAVKGVAAGGLNALGNDRYFYVIEPLMARAGDEAYASYCLLCETTEVAADNSWQEFTLRREARWSDGAPITADDVVFTFDTLMTKGNPQYRFYWGDVERAEKINDRKVRFWFKTKDNAELPMVMGELPVLSKAFWSKRDVEAATLDVPVSSGPYRIGTFEQGRFITLKRDPNYWGKNLALNQGAYNFDEIRIDYYRDEDVSFEAFNAYQFDLRIENTSARWATAYETGAVKAGLMTKDSFTDGQPDTVQVFTLNLRRAKFADVRVRQALALAFDFDWGNKTLSYGLYAPMSSYYTGSELAATGLPQGEELQILEKYRAQIPSEVFTTPFTPPRTDGSGSNRGNLLKARALLSAAGWETKNGVLVHAKTGEKFEFEFLLAQQGLEKWVNPYLQNLARLGITGKIRLVDVTQYLNRLNAYDFDMLVGGTGQSLSPGNEQREMWGATAADRPGGRNLGGIKNPAVDAIIEDLVQAKTRESLVAHTRALDRVLLWNWYAVPMLSHGAIWWAYWNKFGHPARNALQGPHLATWWLDAEKAARVESDRKAVRKP
ncbi:MAG: ABC transporter substrate-binding protein [Rhodospirillaceae bacterium]|nr:ABC transporter substrate-binding protein [Rhodospirillaceae bacterium]